MDLEVASVIVDLSTCTCAAKEKNTLLLFPQPMADTWRDWYTVKVQMTSTKAVCLRFQAPLTSDIVHQQEIFVHHSLTAQWTSEALNM